MNFKFALPKVPTLALTLRRLRQRAAKKAGLQDEWECQERPQQAPGSKWWKNVSEEQWATQQRPQQAPPKAQPVKEKTPPKDEPPKTGKAPRSRVGRVQIRPNQVRKNRIRKVKPTALRDQNMGVARDMLGRVARSGKPQSPKVVHVKIMILILPSGAKHTWLQATV